MNISIEIKERDTDHIDIFVAGEIDAYTAPKVKEALEVYQVKEGIVLRIDLTEVSYMDHRIRRICRSFQKLTSTPK